MRAAIKSAWWTMWINEVRGLVSGDQVIKYDLFDSSYKPSCSLMVKNSFLCLHDVIPKGHIVGLNELYHRILASGKFKSIGEYPSSYLAVLQKV